jgi:DNA gyrase subunit A
MMLWFVWLRVEYAYLLVDGQGNFGSVDESSSHALHEARMRKISEEIMADIEKKSVDFQLNFDDTV